MLSSTVIGLGPLKDEVVFVGGATIELYITARPALRVRPTDDVDCVVEVASRMDYYKLEERLRAQGFTHAPEERIVCRWKYKDVLVDVMPIEGDILGFTNRWYRQGFERSILANLGAGLAIRIFDIPHLIASKIEAFKGRGQNDFVGSPDMEDIVTVIDGVPDIQEKLLQAPENVATYLKDAFGELLGDDRFLDCLEGHLPLIGRAERVARALEILRAATAAW